MNYETSTYGVDGEFMEVNLEIEYSMASEIADNGQTVWYVEEWIVTEVDGEKLSREQQNEWNNLMKDEAEDIENQIMEWEA